MRITYRQIWRKAGLKRRRDEQKFGANATSSRSWRAPAANAAVGGLEIPDGLAVRKAHSVAQEVLVGAAVLLADVAVRVFDVRAVACVDIAPDTIGPEQEVLAFGRDPGTRRRRRPRRRRRTTGSSRVRSSSTGLITEEHSSIRRSRRLGISRGGGASAPATELGAA